MNRNHRQNQSMEIAQRQTMSRKKQEVKQRMACERNEAAERERARESSGKEAKTHFH